MGVKSRLQKRWMVTPRVMTRWKLLKTTNIGLQTEISTSQRHWQSQVDSSNSPGEQKHRLLLIEVTCLGMSRLFFNKNHWRNSKQNRKIKTYFPHILRFILNRYVLYMTNRLYRTALAENGGTAVTLSLEAKHCPSLAAASRVSKSRRIRFCYTTKCLSTVCGEISYVESFVSWRMGQKNRTANSDFCLS